MVLDAMWPRSVLHRSVMVNPGTTFYVDRDHVIVREVEVPSGGAVTSARALAKDGFHVVCAARRRDRIEALAEEIGGTAVVCDVTVA